MNRREWLKCVSALGLGAATAPLLAAVADAHAATKDSATAPGFFSPAQVSLLSAVADAIIPRTDTPGALDAGVPRFIELMLRDVYPHARQASYLASMAAFASLGGTPFQQRDAAGRTALLARLQGEALAAGAGLDQRSAPAFALATRKLTMLGFFMSQPGCTEVLQYVAVPGGYQADVPLSQAGNGHAWAVETVLRI